MAELEGALYCQLASFLSLFATLSFVAGRSLVHAFGVFGISRMGTFEC